MSTTIDQRVVEMRFDNKHFESNVSTTMSTLDKLKKSLNLTGASKGLENISTTANKVNMSGLAGAVQTVSTRFSALQVAGVTALANITNSAVNAGKQIVRSLTIDPIKSGFSEYELKMGSIQTIMASTGESLATVNEYLEELNKYSDQTIYSFSDMTQNIGKFTNAGVNLEDAVAAIKGISNEAALSGANANEASRAMYNFAQALSAGYVKLIDWKSIENANMATVSFKEELIKTAVEMGTLTKVTNGYKTAGKTVITATQNFNDSLQDQWMTSEVLIKTLKKYASEETEIGEKATLAATEVKTFSQMLDTLKESAQSGWAQTWEILFGDFEEGKNLWTSIGNAIGGIIDNINETRNGFLENFMGSTSTWEELVKKIKEAGSSTDEFEESVKKIVGEDEFKKIVEDAGSFENAIKRGKFATDDLKKAISGLIETAGGLKTDALGKRTLWWGHTGDDVEQVQKILDALDYDLGEKGVDGRIGAYTSAAIKQFQKENGIAATGAVNEETVSALKEAAETINAAASATAKLKAEWTKLIDGLEDRGGRALIVDAFGLLGEQLQKIIDAITRAWNTVFGDDPIIDADQLYALIEKIHDLAESFEISEDAAKNFERIATGVFAALDISAWITKSSLNTFFKLLDTVLTAFDTDLLSIAADIADYIVVVRDWIKANTPFVGMTTKIGEALVVVISGIRDVINAILGLESVQYIIEYFKGLIKDLFGVPEGVDATWIDSFTKKIEAGFAKLVAWIEGDSFQAGIDIVLGLAQGIKSKLSEPVNAIIEVATNLIEKFKSMLGIASPSKVFIALGGFIIAGLILGLTKGGGEIGETIKGIALKIGEFLKNIDWSALFVVGTIAAGFLIWNKFVKVLEKFANPFEGIGKILDGFSGVLNSFADLNKAKAQNIRTDAMLNLAKALVLLVGALVLLAYAIKKDWKSVAWAMGALAVLFGELFLLAKASEMIEPKAFGKMSVMLLGMSTALLITSFAIKNIASLDTDKAWTAIIQMGLVIVGFAGMLWAFGKLVDPKASANIDKAGVMMLKMAVAIGVLGLVAKLLGTISDEDIDKTIDFVAKIGIAFMVLVATSQFAGEHADKAGKLLLKMSIAIGILALCVKLLSNIPQTEMTKAMECVAVMVMLFGATLLVFKVVSGSKGDVMTKAGSMLLKMAIAIGLVALTVKLLSSMTPGEILKGLGVVVALEILFGGILFLFQYIGKKKGDVISKAGSMMLKMAAAIGIIAIAIRFLAKVSGPDIWKCIGTITVLEILFAGMVAVSKYAGKHAAKAGEMLMKMATAILIITAAIAILSLLDPKDIAVATGTIGTLVLTFAALVASTKHMPADCMKSLIAMMAAFALVATAIGILSVLDPKGVLASGTALSILMLSIAGAMKIMSSVKNVSTDAYIALGAVVLALGAVAVILGLMSKWDVEPSIETALSLSILLVALADVTLILSRVGPFAKEAVMGALAFDGVVLAIGGLLLGLGALVKYIPHAEEFLDKGVLLFQKIGEAFGSLIGGFFGGIRDGFADGLPQFATDLSDFMTNLEPFLDGASKITPEMGEGVKNLTQAILILTAANIWESVASWITGGSSLADFAEQLVPFGESMAKYAEAVKGIDPNTVTNSATAAKALAEFADNIPNYGGLVSIFSGDNSMITFGLQLVSFGGLMKKYADAIAGMDTAAVTNSATAAKALAEFADNVPNAAGFAAIFAGENNIVTFGSQLVSFGGYMKKYAEVIAGMDTNAVTNSATAGKALAELASTVPNTGGLWSLLAGDNSISTFGWKLVSFGSAMKDYSDAIVGIDALAVSSSATAGQALCELANNLPNTGGLWSWITGENDMSSFASKIVTFGDAMKKYGEAIAGIDTGAVTASATAAQSLAELAKSLPNSGGLAAIFGGSQDLTNFATKIVGFGGCLVKYSESVSGINISAIYAASTAVNNIYNTVKNLKELDLKGVGSLKSAVKTLATTNFKGFQEVFGQSSSSMTGIGENLVNSIAKGVSGSSTALSSAAAQVVGLAGLAIERQSPIYGTAGVGLAEALAKGINRGTSNVQSAVTVVVILAASTIYTKYSDFYNAGGYLVQGFARGITDNTFIAEAKAAAMAKAAYEKAKEELDINSPSRVFMPLGSGVVEGFAKGISDNEYLAVTASEDMADSTITGFGKAISKIQSVINSDMDVQPTIRPVMDLSDVRAGVGSMNDMLSAHHSVGIMSNVRAINTMMNRNRQNGRNDDVVSAIDRLRKDMGNVGGTTNYNVNGVTYAGDTDVADAISALVQYAIIERRT